MNSTSSYQDYAADCLRLAEREASPEAKTVMLNMALCWVRLAEQKQALAPAGDKSDDDAPPEAKPAAEAPAKTRRH